MMRRAICSIPAAVSWSYRRRYLSTCSVKLFDSLEKAPVVYAPTAEAISWYCCGPTVYDSAHLGHARTYVCFDIARRVLERLLHRPVRYVMGVTDVDDKIIARAAEWGVAPAVVAQRFEAEFLGDMASLGVRPPTALVRVTEHIDCIVAHVAAIRGHGFAYDAPDGSGVYLDTQAMGRAYGKLRPPGGGAGLADGADGAATSSSGSAAPAFAKRHPHDFALWKAAAAPPPGGKAGLADAAVWPSPWGWGRPGWHVECSAMVSHVMGDSLDIHSGGIDLAFPHHCNEIAQAEAANGWVTLPGTPPPAPAAPRRWARVWLHSGHLHIAGRKMSKSLKNFVTVRELLRVDSAAGLHALLLPGGVAPQPPAPSAFIGLGPAGRADAFRLWCLSHSYRSNVVLVPAQLDEAAALLLRLQRALDALTAVAAATASPGLPVEPAAGGAAAGAGAASSSGESVAPRPAARWTDAEAALCRRLEETLAGVDADLSDDVRTQSALRALTALASEAQATLASDDAGATADAVARSMLAWQCAHGVADWLAVFGLSFPRDTLAALDAHSRGAALGAPRQAGVAVFAPANGPGAQSAAVVDALVAFRADVRLLAAALAKEAKRLDGQGATASAPPGAAGAGIARQLFELCDALRDSTLPALGWTISDSKSGSPPTRYVPGGRREA